MSKTYCAAKIKLSPRLGCIGDEHVYRFPQASAIASAQPNIASA
jgi:hypothetical protein